MQGSDLYSGSALSGGLSGATAGASLGTMVAPGIGTAIGAGIGGLAGLFGGASASSKKKEGTKASKEAIQAAMNNINAFRTKDYEQRIADLKQAQSFYGPALNAWNSAYGTGPAPQRDGGIGLAGQNPVGRF